MKVISTNIGSARSVSWRGKEVITGIFKSPATGVLNLGKETVQQDVIADRRVHGGTDKACYLFSADHYPYWKELYPGQLWDWGMFGENLTVAGLNEAEILVGDIYDIGTARVQVSQPREPCFKLGIRFENQQILKQFINHGYPGTYVRVLNEGVVQKGDEMKLVERSTAGPSIRDMFILIYSAEKDQELLKQACSNTSLPLKKREKLKKYIKKGGS